MPISFINDLTQLSNYSLFLLIKHISSWFISFFPGAAGLRHPFKKLISYMSGNDVLSDA